jgi:hypothetical protein
MTYSGAFSFGAVYPLIAVNSVSQPLLVQGTTYWLEVQVLPNAQDPSALNLNSPEGEWAANNTGTIVTAARDIVAEQGSTLTGATVSCSSSSTPFPCNVWNVDPGSDLGFVIADQAPAALPEPGTASLIGFSVLALVVYRLRR